MSALTERLDAIQARVDAATPADVAFLLDLTRKQGAALVEVEEWLKTLDDIEEADPTTATHRNVSAGGLARAIRAALKAKT